MNNRLIITLFGATGDLAARKLYPSFYRLYKNQQLSQHFALIGTARRDWSDDYFRQVVRDSIADEIEDESNAEDFLSHFYYQAHDVNDADHYERLNKLAAELEDKYQTEGNRIFYISLAPELYPVITKHLKDQGCVTDQGYNRLIIEKPFGSDFETAQKLNDQLADSFDEDQIYRIDHYLGKEIVHSIRHLRFSNKIFAPIWNKDSIDHVQISLAEEVGVEDRGVYYEKSGVSKDMIQNHGLQLLALTAMDQPEDDSPDSIRQAKIEILENLHLYESVEEVHSHVVRGQYTANPNQGYLAYRDEENVASDSTTETYLATKVFISLPQWEGVPFYIRSGKRLANKLTKIEVVFKEVDPQLPANRLTINVGPDLGYQIHVNMKKPGYSQDYEGISFDHRCSPDEVEAMPEDYERLIYECMQGNLANFNHWYEVAAAWKFIDRIQELWAQMDEADLDYYQAGSQGPKSADQLISANGEWY